MRPLGETCGNFSRLFILVATIVSFAAGSVALFQFVDQHRRKNISWRRVDEQVKDLVTEIERENFTPDLIVGVGRGGTIVAAMIATNLEDRIELACIDTEVEYDTSGRKHVKLRSPEGFPQLEGRHILLVVAELYSGQDLRDAIDYLEHEKCAQVRTLALLSGPSSVVRPHFIGLHTKHEPIAPWRLTETARTKRI
jgi:hypoxanthine phosphoribosyltransferase